MRTMQSHVRVQSAWLALLDLACLLVSGVIGATARLGADEFGEYVVAHLDGWIVFFGSVILANYLAGSYRLQHTFSRFNLVVTWFFSVTFALLVLGLTSYAWFTLLLGRGVLLLWVGSYSVISLTLKMLVFRRLFRSRLFVCRTAILGTGPRAREIRQTLESSFVLPAHKVMAFVLIADSTTASAAGDEAMLDGVPLLRCAVNELSHLVRNLGVNLIAVGPEDAAVAALYPQLRRLRFEGIEVLRPLTIAEFYSGRTPLDQVTEDALMQASMESEMPVVRRVKRLFDIVVALFLAALFLPFAAAIAALIKLGNPRGRVLYRQLRVGQFGKTFSIFKFRTMRENAERATGAVWATSNDERVTRLGRVLRKYRLDEIPQLLNILRGEMSMVGPRPERPSISAELARSIPFFEERENVMPGLTGWAQIRHPYGSTVDDARRKLEYDLYYIKHVSFSLDLQIILSTLRIMVLGKERTM